MDQLPAAFIEEVIPLLSHDSFKKTIELDGKISNFAVLAINRLFRCFLSQHQDGTIYRRNSFTGLGTRYVDKLVTEKYDYKKGYGSLEVQICLTSQNQTLIPEIIQEVLQKQYFVRDFCLSFSCRFLSKKYLEIMAQWNITSVQIYDALTEDVIDFLKFFELKNQICSLNVTGDCLTASSDVFFPFMKQRQFTTITLNYSIGLSLFELIIDFWQLENNAQEMRGKTILLPPWFVRNSNEVFANDIKDELQRVADKCSLPFDSSTTSLTHSNGQFQMKLGREDHYFDNLPIFSLYIQFL
ncbi:hypothetical protein L596_025474 [Steinernema carpocapsae]|uniref:F-box domain-containing protein n=1 Tax=Steinernema carpocapsae TaxID=34508 RepID=A0A4U5M7W0_STECR|nr:hypothetical protein L596_025474 [Steinernema carpocapsae]